MKINGLNDSPSLDRTTTGKTPASASAAPGKVSSSSVSLSDLATRLHSIEADLATSEPFDAAKVEEIKQAMRDGQFKVNPEVVADRLIQSMKELLGRNVQ